MAIRIVGVDLPQNKRGEIALTYIYGIGRSSSAKILDKAGIDRDLKVKDWTDDQAAKIREIIGVDSIGFLSIDACDKLAEHSTCGFCKGCFTGEYPCEIPACSRKLKAETYLSEKA